MRRTAFLLALASVVAIASPRAAQAQYGGGPARVQPPASRPVPVAAPPPAGVSGATPASGGGPGPTPPPAGAGANAGAGATAGAVPTPAVLPGAVSPQLGTLTGAVSPQAGPLPGGVSAQVGTLPGAVSPQVGTLTGAAPTQTTSVPGTTSAPGATTGTAPGYPAGQPDYAAYYLYLSQLYGYNVGPSSPEAQAEVQNALTQYFSNGAAATSVPTSGPAAEYFTNGAAAVTEPTSVIPDYTFSPPPAAPEQTAAPPEASPPPPVEEDAGVAPEPDAGSVPLETNGTEGTGGGGPPQREPGNPSIGPTSTGAPLPVPAPPATIFLQAPPAEPLPPAPAPVAKAATGTIIGYMLGGVGVGAFLVSLGVFLGPRVRPRSTST